MAEQVRSQILNKLRSFFCCLPFLRNTVFLLLKYSNPALAAAILSLQNHHPVFEVSITKASSPAQLRHFILTEAARIPFCKADSTEGCIAVQWEAAVCIWLLCCEANVIVSRPYKLPDVDNQLKCVSLSLRAESNMKTEGQRVNFLTVVASSMCLLIWGEWWMDVWETWW